MPRGFEWWFGGIDLNQPLHSDEETDVRGDGAGTSVARDVQGDGAGTSAGPTDTDVPNVQPGPDVTSRAQTGVTLSSEDSDGEDEVQSTPEGFVPKTPFIGMLFASLDEALVHYNRYAKHVGFSVKIESSRKSAKDGEKDKSVFVCNKSGKNPEVEEVPLKQRKRTITKLCDCKAKMRVKRTGARWQVTQFVEDHTHDVIQKFALKKYLRSHKKIPKDERKLIDLLHEVNVSSGRIMQIMAELYGNKQNVPYDSKTVSNYMAKSGEKDKFQDIPELLEYFEELKKQDPRFYFKFYLDELSRVERIFWVDGAARDVYKMYNDCISFDTTYMTNRYKMPCASIIGINRYGQSIQLGCGFVRNERIADFVWLFEMFLDAMDGLHPDNIITDQDGAMRSPILVFLVHTVHRNCRWHIMQKVQEKLGPFIAEREELRKDFNEVIDYSLSIEEFENKWSKMLIKHDIVENAHFLDIYDLRQNFVPVYFQHRFFPFLQTTARSEGFNAVLKKYVSPHDSLFRFFKQYMKLQEQIDVAEDSHEFVGEDKTVRLWSDFPMEQQILDTYTLPIYNRFQVELCKITSYNALDRGGGVFEIVPIQGAVYGYGRRSYMIDVDLENEIYNCQCCNIKKDGILCCHVMKVMSHLGAVHRIPDHYILARWSKPPPDIVVQTIEPKEVVHPAKKLSRKDMRMLRYGNLCNDFAKLAVGLASSEKTKEIAEKHMKAMEKEMADLKKATVDALKRKKGKAPVVPGAIDMADGAPMEEDPILATNRRAQDPLLTATKGRPAHKRRKSGLQLQKPHPTKCTLCKEIDHASQNCPLRLADPGKHTTFSLFK